MHMNSPKRIEPAITSSPDVRCKPGSAPPSNVLKTGDKEFRRGPDTFPLRSEKRVTGLRSRKARTPKAKHLYFAVLCPDDPLWNVGSRSSDDQDRYRVENDNLGGFEDTAYEFEMPSAHDEIGILLIPVHNSIAPTIPAVDLMVEQNDKVHTPEVEQRDGHGREDSVDQVQEPGAKMQKNGALHYLIVDDVMMNRRMVHRVLSSYHHIVSQATDGKDCLKVWEEITAAGGTVDVVLMDNSMPIMTGQQKRIEMNRRLEPPVYSCSISLKKGTPTSLLVLISPSPILYSSALLSSLPSLLIFRT